MRREKWQAVIALGVIIGLTGCGDGKQLSVAVESLGENLSALEQAAVLWRQDAYLTNADIPLRSSDYAHWRIAAGFQSPSEQLESILIILELDGSITTQRIQHSVPARQFQPITRANWRLDAADALERGLDDQGRRFLEENADFQCSSLVLERDVGVPNEPVVWRLTLSKCFGESWSQRTIINAINGEILSRETYPSIQLPPEP